jgi:WD40 repeat protein
MTFSPDENYMAAGYGYNAVLSYRDYPIDNYSDILIQHTSAILDLAFNHEGTRFASASEDWRIGYCYVSSLTCDSILYLKAHQGPVNSLAFSPDDRWLVSGGEDGNVLVWNAQFPYVSHSLVPPILFDRRYSVVGLAYSPDGKTLASSNWDGTIRLWDVDSGSIDLTIPVNQGDQGMITISPDGTKLAVAAQSPPHRIWNIDGSVYRNLPLDGYTSTVAFSPDGKWLATDNNNKFICLWAMDDPGSDCQVLSLPGHQTVTRLAFSPDGRFLASDAGSKVLLWDLSSEPPVPQELGSHSTGSSIFSLAFSPDGNKLASGGTDYTIQLWNLQDRPIFSLTIPNSGRFVRSMAFSPDSLMLVSSNEDWTVRWWDVNTGQPLVAPVQVRSLWRLDSAASSPDGRWVATGSFDGIIDIWPGNIEQWGQLACRIANRNLSRAEYAQFIDPDPAAYDKQYMHDPTCPEFAVQTLPVPKTTP